MKEKRLNRLQVLLTDSELIALQDLQRTYSADGANISLGFLFRYGVKRIPRYVPPFMSRFS